MNMARFPGVRPTMRATSRSWSPRPGLAVFWILPDDLAGELHGVPEGKRGDLGRFTLKPGVSLNGRVLDVQGKPIAGVFVTAERRQEPGSRRDPRRARRGRRGQPLGGHGQDGSFTLAPLPAGEYRVLPADRSRDGSERHKIRPLPAVFTPHKVTLKEGETPKPLEIRASPHVVIEAQWVDGTGKPTTGFASHIFGQIDGDYWFGEAKVDSSGKTTALVPHGLEKAQLNVVTNEHHAIRWRLTKDSPLSLDRQIDLGTLDHDVTGIEIVHYNAPIAMVKAETKDKKPVPGLQVSARYRDRSRTGARNETTECDSRSRMTAGFARASFSLTSSSTWLARPTGSSRPAASSRCAEGKTEEIMLVLEPIEEMAPRWIDTSPPKRLRILER